MLFLTATPFQLGHYELLNVLRLFLTVRWEHGDAPPGGHDAVDNSLKALEASLNEAQRRARQLEAAWSELAFERVVDDLVALGGARPSGREDGVDAWWRAVEHGHNSALASRFSDLVRRAQEQKCDAEKHLGPWVIRHNRERYFEQAGAVRMPRRVLHAGRAIETCDVTNDRPVQGGASGIDLHGDSMLPFLLSIRAQAELARASDSARAYFAEGLASSYEAFHHTRSKEAKAYDHDSEEDDEDDTSPQLESVAAIQKWYRDQISCYVPAATQEKDDLRAREHPKVRATVERVVDLWERGEKSLVFCFYIQTARALRLHISNEIERRMIGHAAAKLGLGADEAGSHETRETLERITERCARPDSPFYVELNKFVRARVDEVFGTQRMNWLDDLEQALHRFLRSFSYVARYFPLDNRAFADAVRPGARVDEEALAPFRSSLEASDASGMKLVTRVDTFLRFIKEKWEDQGGGERKAESELDRYLSAFEKMQFRSKTATFRADEENYETDGRRRVLANVRFVTGEGMSPDQRDTVMRAFNSPLFPEVLVASQVLAEGVDLHRFCRFIIHHDLYWNPSVIEQRNGRVDRIQSKSDSVGRPIHIFEPFIAATADEKMFRVVKDRERWFQVVMGDDFKLSEATTEKRLERLPLPASIARALSFDLAVDK